jgi:hypothetical protein
MNKLNLLVAVTALALTLIARAGVAASFSQAADATIKAAETLVEQAHGIHRSCRLGPVSRWGGAVRWHRHVGPAHVPVRC